MVYAELCQSHQQATEALSVTDQKCYKASVSYVKFTSYSRHGNSV